MYKYDCSLQDFLKRKKSEEYGLEKRLKLAMKVLKEVQKAHGTKIIHRDIKPSNVMLDSNFDPVLVDFGLGRYLSGLEGSVGTPGFTPPEQISGDGQSVPVDVFSLGKLLVLILFEWKVGWSMLVSPKTLIKSRKIAPLVDVLDTISLMLQVKLCSVFFIYLNFNFFYFF